MPPEIAGSECTGGILDHPQLMSACQFPERYHIRTKAEEMNGDDPDRPLRDVGLDLSRIQVEGLQIDIAEDGASPMNTTTLAVEIQVNAGTTTSSPASKPRDATAICSADVQELVAIE